MTERQQPTCLHADSDGVVWKIGSGGTLQPYSQIYTSKNLPNGTFRLIGCKANYRIITELYSKLRQPEESSTILIGSTSLIYPQHASYSTVLSKLATLSVHDSSVNSWHVMRGREFNNYFLLLAYKEEGYTDLVRILFSYHATCKYFEFIGLSDREAAVGLIAAIVDPRWFVNSVRPNKTDKLESSFGLRLDWFEQHWNLCDAVGNTQNRLLQLLTAVHSLDPLSVIHLESQDIVNEEQRTRFECKLLLRFIVRTWLDELGKDVNFDVVKLFKRAATQDSYNMMLENKL